MKKLEKIRKNELLLINGGDEYTYNKGAELGEFMGKVAGMIDRFIEIFK